MPRKVKENLTKRAIEAATPGTILWDAQVRGFGLRVTPAGTKTFVFQFRVKDGGKQGRITIGQFPAFAVEEAREEAMALARQVASNNNPSLDRKAARLPRTDQLKTLRDLAGEFTDHYAVSEGHKPKTIVDAKRMLAPVLEKHGDRPVLEFTTADIRAIRADARERLPRKVSARRATGAAATSHDPDQLPVAVPPAATYKANRLLAVLSKMFALAVEHGWRNDNPCKGVKKYKENLRQRYLSEDEVERLLIACDRYDQTRGVGAADAIRLLLFTGARLQEILTADWTQFDLEGGVWEKPSAHTKTKIVHRVQVGGPALETLRALRARNPTGRLLFPGRTQSAHPVGVVPMGNRRIETARVDLKKPWSAIVKLAGLTNVRLHDLRRTTASFMASDQVDGQTIGKVLGHTQASTTARYVSIFQSVQGEALKAAGERMVALKGRTKPATVIPMSGTKAGEALSPKGQKLD